MITVQDIHQYGDAYKINKQLDTKNIIKTLDTFEDKWSQYNTRKGFIARQGLCVFNYDGVCGPNPALDSLKEYNNLHGTSLKETDANKSTELYHDSTELQKYFKPIRGSVVRTHFLRLKPGGFFPPHRDHTRGLQNTFRMIIPILNCSPPSSNFVLENNILNMDNGYTYIINTTKLHWLFNASANDNSIWLVINANVDKACMDFIESGL